jgi:hypothetical protein
MGQIESVFDLLPAPKKRTADWALVQVAGFSRAQDKLSPRRHQWTLNGRSFLFSQDFYASFSPCVQ